MGDIDSLDAKVSFKRSVPVRLFKYHSDWNWLMEVVEKIESLDYDFQILGGCWIIIEDVHLYKVFMMLVLLSSNCITKINHKNGKQ